MSVSKIMIYNMHHGRGLDGQPNLERIAALVKDTGPDIVGFNEVDRFFARRSGFTDQFGWFCRELGMHCAFGAAITRKKGSTVREYGNALFSRYPIVSHQNHGLRARGLRISEPRSLLEVEIDWSGRQTVKVFLTHLSVIPLLRRIQTDLIVQRVSAAEVPVILMGDFNMIPGSGSWNKLAAILSDTAQEVHGTAMHTFPSVRPLTQKDYIFVSESTRVQSVQIIDRDRFASDHLPLLAALHPAD
jgi:endonuclease/exonuclease/phosphatase family metal-dependent hydrolase